MNSPAVTLSLRDHFVVCAAGFMGASAGFALSGGNYLVGGLAGLYAAGVARSVIESRVSGQLDYERPTISNLSTYLKNAPRSTVKKYNDATVMCLATVGGGITGALVGYGTAAHFGLLALPFGIAAGTGVGGFSGWVAGHALRFLPMGALSVCEATARGANYIVGNRPQAPRSV